MNAAFRLFLPALLIATLALFPVRAFGLRHRSAESPAPPSALAPDGAPAAEPTHDPFAPHLARGRTTRGMNPHRQLHFTFDDGPRLDTTPQLLEHLDDFGIRATFFLVTRGFDGTNRVDRAKAALAQDIARRGHTIGGHTHTHPNLTRLKLVEIQDELNRAEATFEAVFGARPVLFRAPYGARNRRVNGELRRRGYTHVLWNITSGDTTSRRPQDIVDAFERSLDIRERHPLGPGGIVLLHDTNPRVVEAFPAMVRVLQRRNCELLDAGEELWDVLDTPEAFITLRGEEASTERDEASREARQEVLIAATAERCADERSQDALVDPHL